MTHPVNHGEAVDALAVVRRSREAVLAEIDVPAWYWWAVAAGWIGVGCAAQFGNTWVESGATLAFGALHSSIAHWVVGGRQRTSQLRVRSEVAGHWTPLVVLGTLCAFVVVTIVGALIAHGAGVTDPVLVASLGVAVLIVIVGPVLMRGVRYRAKKRTLAS
jgi:hypothetical protein